MLLIVLMLAVAVILSGTALVLEFPSPGRHRRRWSW